MFFRILITFMFVSAMPLFAESRAWRSSDGGKSIQGEFVKREKTSVIILRADHREVTIPLEEIHHEDLAWLNERHPLPAAPPQPKDHLFDKLRFGDNRAEVTEKLKASKLVQSTQPETMLARTGLNGIFHTVHKVGGLEASLYFDWTESGALKELTLQTTPVSGNDAQARLTACWKEFIELLTSLHGNPINAHDKLDITAVPDESMSATHLWKLDHRGTAMLGCSRDGDDYQISVRFTTENIQPVVIPEEDKPGI